MPTGVYKRTPEQLKNMSKAHLGKKLSDETKMNMSIAQVGKHAGEKHNRWRGGKIVSTLGYTLIHKPEHPFADKNNYVYNCRLIAEKYLGRYLDPTEVVHHINFDKSDDKPENLFVFENKCEHMRFHGCVTWRLIKPNWLKSNL